MQNISIQSNGVEAFCDSDECQVEFSSIDTPKISSVTPTLFKHSNTTLKIYGESFGNHSSQINVKIGSQNCAVVSSNDKLVECILEKLDLGNQRVNIKTKGK